MKRIITVLFSLILMIPALSACQGSQANDQANKTTEQAVQTADQASQTADQASQATDQANKASDQANKPAGTNLPEVTLRFYLPGEPTPYEDQVAEHLYEMSKDVLNARINKIYVPFGDYADKLVLLASSGDNWDFNYDATWNTYNLMLNNGAYLPLNDLLDTYAPAHKAYLKEAGVLEWATVNGKIMALPKTTPLADRAYAIIREDLRKKYNIGDDFSTIEKLEAYIETVLANEPDMEAINGVFKTNTSLDDAMWAILTKYGLDRPFAQAYFEFTYELADPNIKIVPLERTECFREVAKIRRRWVEKGWIPRNAVNMESKAAGITGNVYTAYIFDLTRAAATEGFEGPGESKGYAMYPDAVSSITTPMNDVVTFNKNAANPERAMMFVAWLNEKQENYDAFMYGIEGVTFVLKEKDGVMQVERPEGQDSTNSYVDWFGKWGFESRKFQRPGFNNPLEVSKAFDEYLANPKNITPPVAGFSFNPEPVKTEITRRQSVMDEYGVPLRYGMAEDVDAAVDEYIQKMNEAGTDVILAELQRQMDAFKASK